MKGLVAAGQRRVAPPTAESGVAPPTSERDLPYPEMAGWLLHLAQECPPRLLMVAAVLSAVPAYI